MDGALPTKVPTDWVFDSLPVPAVVCDLGGTVRAANDAFVAFAGVAVPPGTHWRAFLAPEDCDRLATAAGSALEDDLRGRRHAHDVAVSFRRPDGTVARAELRLRMATAEGEKLLVATAHNLEEQQRQVRKLAASEHRLRMLATAVRVGVVSSHAGIRATYVNDRCAELFESEVDDLVGFGWLDRVHPEDVDAMVAALEEVVGEATERDVEVRLRARAGEEPRNLRARVVPVQTGGEVGFVASFEELADVDPGTIAELTAELRTDPLTGLANRRMLWESLARLAEDEIALPAACFVDLDDFKQVNDRHGHESGDSVLRTVADRLRTACRDGDLICRFGGDEFVVLLPHVASDEIALTVARRIVSTIARPMSVGDEVLEMSVSVGVVWTGTPGVDLSGDGGELLRAADVALYKAKRLGKNRAALFDEATRGEGLARREAIDALRGLLADSGPTGLWFRHVASVEDGSPLLLEAFAPVGPDVTTQEPDWVTSLAAEAGVALEWDRRVLADAVAALRDTGGARRVLVTPSAASVLDDGYRAGIAALADVGVAVAVTEALAAAGDERMLEGLRHLRSAGAWVVVRGAGGPDSTFATLRAVPFDVLELDAGLAEAATSDPTAAATVAGLASFAARFGARVVAPGVTSVSQIPVLAGLGVTGASGPRWSPSPAPVSGQAWRRPAADR